MPRTLIWEDVAIVLEALESWVDDGPYRIGRSLLPYVLSVSVGANISKVKAVTH